MMKRPLIQRINILTAMIGVALTVGGVDASGEVLLYPVSPMERIIDNRPPAESAAREKASEATMRIFAVPGQIEPASFVIHPLGQELAGVRLTIPELVSGDPESVISAAHIDDFVVTCWYAAACEMWGLVRQYVYWPELLLKDPGIIAVDHATQRNELKFEGKLPSIPERVQPFAIAAGSIRQVWLNVRVPDDAAPGVYRGDIAVAAGDGRSSIALELEVLDIALAEAQADLSVFQTGAILAGGTDYYRLMVRNMVEHGVNFAYVSSPLVDESAFREGNFDTLKTYLDIWREEGGLTRRAVLPNTHLTRMIWGARGQAELSDELKANARAYAQRLFAFLSEYDPGVEWAIYGTDEQEGDARLQAIFRDAGLRVLNASNTPEQDVHYNLFFTYVWFPHRGVQALMRFAREHGNRVGYYTPMTQFKDPVLYRYKAGFNLWNKGGAGYIPWAYLHSIEPGKWEQTEIGKHHFDFVLPAENGLVNTVQWEGYREGADDMRYLSTLALIVEKASERAIGGAWIDRGREMTRMTLIQPYNETQSIRYLNPDHADYTPFSEAFPWRRLDEARREVADVILAIQARHPELHSRRLVNDRTLAAKAAQRRLDEFDIEALADATSRRNDRLAAFREAHGEADWKRAGAMARELKEWHAARREAWLQAGFSWTLSDEDERMIREAIEKAGQRIETTGPTP